jgi:hypothetical protein
MALQGLVNNYLPTQRDVWSVCKRAIRVTDAYNAMSGWVSCSTHPALTAPGPVRRPTGSRHDNDGPEHVRLVQSGCEQLRQSSAIRSQHHMSLVPQKSCRSSALWLTTDVLDLTLVGLRKFQSVQARTGWLLPCAWAQSSAQLPSLTSVMPENKGCKLPRQAAPDVGVLTIIPLRSGERHMTSFAASP